MHSLRVALIGANSRIGPWILDALLLSPKIHHIDLLVRPTSQPIPAHSKCRKVIVPSDPPTTSDLAAALQGADVLICALNPSQLETQLRLADACIQAGVRRFVPADWGSMRSDDPYVLDLLPNFRNKQRVRQHCQRLAEDHAGSFTWTSVITGHFFDYGLESELLGIDLHKGEALMFDGGEDEWSATTREQIGRAVVKVLEKEEETANKMLLVDSFIVTQKQVVDAIDKVRDGPRLRQIKVASKEYVQERIPGAAAGEYDATEEMVAVLGIKRSNWKRDAASSNKLLGLDEEDVVDVVRKVLKGGS